MNRRRFLLSSAAALAIPAAAQKPPDLIFDSALAAAAAIRRKRISSVELVKACFERVRQFHARLNAVVVPMEEQALKRAAAADAALAHCVSRRASGS